MWTIFIATNHYTQINIELEKFFTQTNITFNHTRSKAEAAFRTETIFITIKSCGSAEQLSLFRGYKADTVFTEPEWINDFEARWRLDTICHRFMMIQPIEKLLSVIKGEMRAMYDYRSSMIEDIKKYVIDNDWVNKNYDFEEGYETMLDKLYLEVWDKDEITGNGLNHYASEEKCAQFLIDNLALYFEAAKGMNLDTKSTNWDRDHTAQCMDAVIRCYLLRECLEEACNQM